MVVLIPIAFMLGLFIGVYVRYKRSTRRDDVHWFMQMWVRKGYIVNKYDMKEGK